MRKKYSSWIWGVSLFLFGAGSIFADKKNSLKEVAQFIQDYQKALQTKNKDFLQKNTQFPIIIQSIEYDMEAKNGSSTFSKDRLQNETKAYQKIVTIDKSTLLALAQMGPEQMKRGQQKCKDQKPEEPDFQKGPAAFSIQGDHILFSYLVEPCSAEVHVETWHVKKNKNRFLFAKRTIEKYKVL